MECFYELQDQQSSTSMQETGIGRDSNIMLSASVGSPDTSTMSEDDKSMLMNMQLPDYNPYQQLNAYSLSDFSIPASQFDPYPEQANVQSQVNNIQDNTIHFMPQLQHHNNHHTAERVFHSQGLDSFNTTTPQDSIPNFVSQSTPSYLSYYSFPSSAQQLNVSKPLESQQYHTGIQPYAPVHQPYNPSYRLQHMKQHQMPMTLHGATQSQLQAPNIPQQLFEGAYLGNGQSWPLTVAKLRQMNMKSNIKKKVGKAKKKRRTAAAITDPNAPPKPKRNTGLNKPLVLSTTLAAFTGVSELSRPEVVKSLWKYIKENDLQDPADRRYILCDTELKKIFTQDRVNSFAMNRDLSAHLSKKTDSQPSTTPTLEEPDSSNNLGSSNDRVPQTPGISISGEGEDLADERKAEELTSIDIEHLVQSMASVTS
ncbi:hypothetical protein Unana1_08582 [Umbelopsis nana]